MSTSHPQAFGIMPKLVIGLAVSFVVLGILWHGVTGTALERIWRQLLERPSGPMAFRFILQPVMAAIAAFHDGLKDARADRSPYLWVVVRDPRKRFEYLREGLISTARIILLGLAMDAIYQFLVFRTFYPVEALLIALALAFVPYVLLRGPVTRIMRRLSGAAPGTIR